MDAKEFEDTLRRDGGGFVLDSGRQSWPLILLRTPVDLIERRVAVEAYETDGRLEVLERDDKRWIPAFVKKSRDHK